MHILVDTCFFCPSSGQKTDCEILCWILEKDFDLENMCGIPDLFASLAGKDIGLVKELKSLSLYPSLFTACSFLGVQFVTNVK
jgi:hypothetical protein